MLDCSVSEDPCGKETHGSPCLVRKRINQRYKEMQYICAVKQKEAQAK